MTAHQRSLSNATGQSLLLARAEVPQNRRVH